MKSSLLMAITFLTFTLIPLSANARFSTKAEMLKMASEGKIYEYKYGKAALADDVLRVLKNDYGVKTFWFSRSCELLMENYVRDFLGSRIDSFEMIRERNNQYPYDFDKNQAMAPTLPIKNFSSQCTDSFDTGLLKLGNELLTVVAAEVIENGRAAKLAYEKKQLEMANQKAAEQQRQLDWQLEKQRRIEAETAEQARSQQEAIEKSAAENAKLVTQLKAGTRTPTNCHEYMISKGHDPKSLVSKVMIASLIAPTGAGTFAGKIKSIDENTLIISGGIAGGHNSDAFTKLALMGSPDNMILNLNKGTKIFGGDSIAIDSVVSGFSTQTGKRKVKLVNGSDSTIAVMEAICLE